jgi:hypothetical protein
MQLIRGVHRKMWHGFWIRLACVFRHIMHEILMSIELRNQQNGCFRNTDTEITQRVNSQRSGNIYRLRRIKRISPVSQATFWTMVAVAQSIYTDHVQARWSENFGSRFTLFRPALKPIQSVPGSLSPAVKRPGRERDHSSPTNAEVKNRWIYTSTPPYFFVA